MEKVKMAGIRLVLLLLIGLNFSCGGKKPETANQPADTAQVAADTIDIPEYAPEPATAAEILEYRSESLKNYELYIIYPFQDAVQFVLVRHGEARLVTLKEDREPEEGQALNDDEFTVIKFFQESEREGVVTFGEVELTNRADAAFKFRQSQTKRALTIETAYRFAAGNNSGNLALMQSGDAYKFTIHTNTGEHTCELEGMVRIKGNIGYFDGQPYNATCKLIFFFTGTGVQTLQISSNPGCGCAAQASLNARFTASK